MKFLYHQFIGPQQTEKIKKRNKRGPILVVEFHSISFELYFLWSWLHHKDTINRDLLAMTIEIIIQREIGRRPYKLSYCLFLVQAEHRNLHILDQRKRLVKDSLCTSVCCRHNAIPLSFTFIGPYLQKK